VHNRLPGKAPDANVTGGKSSVQTVQNISSHNDEILKCIDDRKVIQKIVDHDMSLIDEAIGFRERYDETHYAPEFDTAQQYYRARKSVDLQANNAKKNLRPLIQEAIRQNVKQIITDESLSFSLDRMTALPEHVIVQIQELMAPYMGELLLENNG